MGSCETLYWHKRWIPIKASLTLSATQRDLLIGSLLGDGTMRIGEGSRNANFKVEHGLQQKEYVEWKYRILRPLVFTEPKISYRYRENSERYPKSWWFRTIRHPLLTEIYQQFYRSQGYKCGRKVVPASVKHTLSPLGLAVWVMDDGSYGQGTIEISTYAFILAEVQFLQMCLRKRFHIETSIVRDRDKGYRLYCLRREVQKLTSIVRPYIIPSLLYKIGFATP